MSDTLYYIIAAVLAVAIMAGIAMMSKVKTARAGNLISALAAFFAIAVTLYKNNLIGSVGILIALLLGTAAGLFFTVKVKMIQMPQAVAVLNGLGGLASMIVGLVAVIDKPSGDLFSLGMASLAIAVGGVTFSGSMVAGGKLQRLIPQKPILFKNQKWVTNGILILTILSILLVPLFATLSGFQAFMIAASLLCMLLSLAYGVLFAIRIGGADMPITISLLNSMSGIAGGIAGIAVSEPLLCAAGGIVGASGIILTQIMCKAMNRSLSNILLGKGIASAKTEAAQEAVSEKTESPAEKQEFPSLKTVKNVVMIPGYGMALAQAQELVKELSDRFEAQGAQVRFAIHPVAGRMPGHMNILLCEVGIPYEMLYEIGDINEQFADCDLVVIVGANDVVNPAANTAVGTPIYGMPILKASEAKHIIVCNYDLKPGYAGVENPLYQSPKVRMMIGDAKDSLKTLLDELE